MACSCTTVSELGLAMDKLLPESNTSHSAVSPARWPTHLRAQSVYLTTLQPTNADELWPLLDYPEIARLFEQTYGQSCSNIAKL